MHQVQSDVWETEVESPFPGLTTHAYLLIREGGNVLFYNASNRSDIEEPASLGGVAYQFLSHRDEVGPSLSWIAERYGNQLGGHVAEHADFARHRTPDILFREREVMLGCIEIIPTPGHSPGSTCFLVSSPTGKRYLFTGDTLFRGQDGGWRAGFIPGHSTLEDARQMAESLEHLRPLTPDVVFGSAFGGTQGYEEIEAGGWERRLDIALEGLQARIASLTR